MTKPKAGILYNDAKPAAKRSSETLSQWFQQQGWEVYAAPNWGGILGYAKPDSPICLTQVDSLAPAGFDSSMQFAVVLGGDGTVLAAARQLAPKGIPLLAVNTGHLGFLTETYLSHLEEAAEAAIAGDYTLDRRSMLLAQVYRNHQLRWEVLSLNEMVLHREPLTSMCHFEVTIGQHSPLDVAADGVILATPTGSTAYALSAGGPVLTPGVPVLQLIPICPHSMASRALVFEDSEEVWISPVTPQPLVLVVDGNAGCYIMPEDQIRVVRAPYWTDLMRLQRPEFFRIMREKLGWGLPHASKPTSVELP
ncbi:NAD(+) kinase [Synechococcus sp. Nb3U1]|uniref:NAD(+) kinase n=1 Tax=Synechococcus sp. Nb3U1 TaxID=1914529 RepID=UPI001F2CAFEA|nr:NAD(+) kinase [Synechococcus sp. Nb3U1]MCF2972396.1 NAD(+) kinase [Synechococcus sp. Nb3U1]